MNKIIVLLLVFSTLVSLFGCGAMETSDYLSETGVVFYPQTILKNEDAATLRAKSMQALIDSFIRFRWDIHSIDKDAGKMTAEACRRGKHCMEVEATIKDDGTVEIIRTPGQTITRNEGTALKGWITNLKTYYDRLLIESLK